jgi:integrase
LAKTSVRQGNFAIKEVLNNPPFTAGEDIRSHTVRVVEKGLNGLCSYSSKCQIGVTEEKGAKNLVSATELKVAGEASVDKGRILDFLWQLKKDGYSDATIRSYTKFLNLLVRKGASLGNGESVKKIIAEQEWQPSTKHLVSVYYQRFAKNNDIPYNPPIYKPVQKLPFIPLESEIDSLIASCGNVTSTMLQLLKETGMRVGEALRLRWVDIDPKQGTITVNDPEKNGRPRVLKVSDLLLTRLSKLPEKDSKKIFGNATLSSFETNYYIQRKHISAKLENPRLLQITFHTLRHWKATMEYHKTKDILHVMNLLGHRSIQNTLIYTQLVNFESNDYYSATAKSIDEAGKLVEAGFEYVLTNSDIMLFRKRK